MIFCPLVSDVFSPGRTSEQPMSLPPRLSPAWSSTASETHAAAHAQLTSFVFSIFRVNTFERRDIYITFRASVSEAAKGPY